MQNGPLHQPRGKPAESPIVAIDAADAFLCWAFTRLVAVGTIYNYRIISFKRAKRGSYSMRTLEFACQVTLAAVNLYILRKMEGKPAERSNLSEYPDTVRLM